MSDIAYIRKHANLWDLITTPLRKVSNCGGSELAGPCPFCPDYGTDRFRLQLYHPNGPRWFCRVCSPLPWHDSIDFVMKRDDCDLPAAIKTLECGEFLPAKKETKLQDGLDREQWEKAARKFIGECCVKLWSDIGKKARDYLHGRGLEDSTLTKWWLGFNDLDDIANGKKWGLPDGEGMRLPAGITIPCVDQEGVHYVKVRRSHGEPRYTNLRGSQFYLYGAQNLRGTEYATLFESELDVLLAVQTGYNIGPVSMPAGQAIRLEWQPLFENIEDVIVAYDEDEAGQLAADRLCRLPHFWRAPHLPAGKDLTEFHKAGGDVFEYLFNAVGVINESQRNS